MKNGSGDLKGNSPKPEFRVIRLLSTDNSVNQSKKAIAITNPILLKLHFSQILKLIIDT